MVGSSRLSHPKIKRLSICALSLLESPISFNPSRYNLILPRIMSLIGSSSKDQFERMNSSMLDSVSHKDRLSKRGSEFTGEIPDEFRQAKASSSASRYIVVVFPAPGLPSITR